MLFVTSALRGRELMGSICSEDKLITIT